MEVKRGDLFYADLSVGVGSEQSGIFDLLLLFKMIVGIDLVQLLLFHL